MARKSDTVGLRLRMPAGVHRLLVASAKRNARSLNHEVLWALAKYLGEDAQKHVEQMSVEQRHRMQRLLEIVYKDPERAAKALGEIEKREVGK
jgi:hypothetical protein